VIDVHFDEAGFDHVPAAASASASRDRADVACGRQRHLQRDRHPPDGIADPARSLIAR